MRQSLQAVCSINDNGTFCYEVAFNYFAAILSSQVSKGAVLPWRGNADAIYKNR